MEGFMAILGRKARKTVNESQTRLAPVTQEQTNTEAKLLLRKPTVLRFRPGQPLEFCTFCGNDSTESQALVAWRNALICSGCVIESVGALVEAGDKSFLRQLAAEMSKHTLVKPENA
jgi:hypothetical protein